MIEKPINILHDGDFLRLILNHYQIDLYCNYCTNLHPSSDELAKISLHFMQTYTKVSAKIEDQIAEISQLRQATARFISKTWNAFVQHRAHFAVSFLFTKHAKLHSRVSISRKFTVS